MRERLIGLGALVGESDHGVSKSLYGHDPDGIEFEVLWTVPREAWGDYEHDAVVAAARPPRRARPLGLTRQPLTAADAAGCRRRRRVAARWRHASSDARRACGARRLAREARPVPRRSSSVDTLVDEAVAFGPSSQRDAVDGETSSVHATSATRRRSIGRTAARVVPASGRCRVPSASAQRRAGAAGVGSARSPATARRDAGRAGAHEWPLDARRSLDRRESCGVRTRRRDASEHPHARDRRTGETARTASSLAIAVRDDRCRNATIVQHRTIVRHRPAAASSSATLASPCDASHVGRSSVRLPGILDRACAPSRPRAACRSRCRRASRARAPSAGWRAARPTPRAGATAAPSYDS